MQKERTKERKPEDLILIIWKHGWRCCRSRPAPDGARTFLMPGVNGPPGNEQKRDSPPPGSPRFSGESTSFYPPWSITYYFSICPFICILSAFYLHFICILFAFYLHSICILFAFYLHFICILFAFHLYFICISFAFYSHFICILFVFYLYFYLYFTLFPAHLKIHGGFPENGRSAAFIDARVLILGSLGPYAT